MKPVKNFDPTQRYYIFVKATHSFFTKKIDIGLNDIPIIKSRLLYFFLGACKDSMDDFSNNLLPKLQVLCCFEFTCDEIFSSIQRYLKRTISIDEFLFFYCGDKVYHGHANLLFQGGISGYEGNLRELIYKPLLRGTFNDYIVELWTKETGKRPTELLDEWTSSSEHHGLIFLEKNKNLIDKFPKHYLEWRGDVRTLIRGESIWDKIKKW